MSTQKNRNSSTKGSTLGRWLTRWFRGGSNWLDDEIGDALDERIKSGDAEEIISPARQIVRGFLERKLAVGALLVLVVMFAVMFIGPLFMPKYTDSYTEVTQQNMAPNMRLMSIPKELRSDLKMVDGFGSFSVGLSNAGKVYIWGSTQLGTTGIDIGNIPEEVRNTKIALVAAGIDHVVAIAEDGKVYGWGSNTLGQYETLEEAQARNDVNSNIAYMPQSLKDEGIDVANVKKLTCGYQATAILMNDGTFYLWGNKKVYSNMDRFLSLSSLDDIDFTLSYIVGLNGKHNAVYTGTRDLYSQVKSNVGEKAAPIAQYLNGRTIEALTATATSVALLLDDGSVCFTGDFALNAVPAPELAEGEDYVQIVGGTHHYSGLTNLGNVYSWGRNENDQAEVPAKLKGVTRLFAGSFQTYAADDDEVIASWGLKGYLFGTDTRGADIFKRIIQGGKMTMTIGAVAVIIEAIIGILIGCIAGYFGGKVDIFLMRVAEIFNAIPFLPFAMILSAVMGHYVISETMRIFIIMCILGVLSWPGLAHLVRGQVLVARESEYVTAAKAMGVRERLIAFKHILPNVMSVVLVNLMLGFGTCMLTESSLSYLGFGVAYPRPTWGNMLNGANNATIINAFWWEWVFTSLFLAITTICINIVGDTLRDVMDPKSNGER